MPTWDQILSSGHIIARYPARNMALLGGMGFAGVGVMWQREDEYLTRWRGYDEAPILEAPQPEADRLADMLDGEGL